ncbi:hypothetical protein PR048_011762 [Dryococelus australis]|uniref:Uncharacterized protein n=1 Tax=Dryococelus australis TaxID=614101 RepID=A0ABQ9HN46_9NEOP|nr:hypothetical protein PR048_011762 [Dryococelus australis]
MHEHRWAREHVCMGRQVCTGAGNKISLKHRKDKSKSSGSINGTEQSPQVVGDADPGVISEGESEDGFTILILKVGPPTTIRNIGRWNLKVISSVHNKILPMIKLKCHSYTTCLEVLLP